MSYSYLKHYTKRAAIASASVLIAGLSLQSCEDEILTGQPEWLHNSIYEQLVNEGEYNYTIRLIDDLGQTDVLSHTGSRTLFAANDSAFERFFSNNTWGVSKYEDLSAAQKRLILNSATITNAYLIELLSSLTISGDDPSEGEAMRRLTLLSALDTVPRVYPDDMPNTQYWAKYKGKNEGMLLMKDDNSAPMIHFLPKFMSNKNFTSDDLSILTNGEATSIDEAWINGKKVIERDITCKNGYIQKIEDVMIPEGNMHDIIHKHPSMSIWAKFLDRYCAPYYSRTASDNYLSGYNIQDSVFILRYFTASNNTNPDGQAVTATLPFDPAQNQYVNSSGGTNLNQDCAAMLVPSDEAVNSWLARDGQSLIEEFGEMDSIPDDVLSSLLDVHFVSSFRNNIPSKFANIVNDASVSMGVKAEDVDSSFVGCNGVVYLTNKVYGPASYTSVMFPALVKQHSTMSVLYWAIENLGFDKYLNSVVARYSLILPSNDAFLSYIDPCSYGNYPNGILYEFSWSDQYQVPQVRRYNYDLRNNIKGTLYETQYIRADASSNVENNLVMNRLNDILDNLIIVGDLSPNKTYYKTKGGATIKIENPNTANMTIANSRDVELGTSVPLAPDGIYEQGNGNAYQIDASIPMSTSKSVYQTLEEHSEYSRFFDLMRGGESDSAMMVSQLDDHSCARYEDQNGAVASNNVRLFNNYNYSVYVPTNAELDKLHDAHILPYWSDYEAMTTDKFGGDQDKTDAAKKVIFDRIQDFLKYHLQDNSLYIGGDSILADENRYETALFNTEESRFYSLLCTPSDGSAIQITDDEGNVRNVVQTPGLYNNMCREYWYSTAQSNRAFQGYLYSSSYVVVHQIDGPLMNSEFSTPLDDMYFE